MKLTKGTGTFTGLNVPVPFLPINSEYSNLPFNEKRERFLNRNRNRIDSLKMAFIYSHETWGDTLAKQHQDQMIALIKASHATSNDH